MFVYEFGMWEKTLWMENSKINNCLESADICDFSVTCHFKKIGYVINNFGGYICIKTDSEGHGEEKRTEMMKAAVTN